MPMRVENKAPRRLKVPREESKIMIPVPANKVGPAADGLLSEQQAKYVEARGMGMNSGRAAHYAGYTYTKRAVRGLEKNPLVIAALKKVLAQNEKASKTTRQQVLDLTMDAIEMARTLEDPTAMLRGVQELAKMCGYYAPEVKKFEFSAKRTAARGELALLTEDQLIEMADGHRRVIEGECEVVDSEMDTNLLGND